MTPEDELYPERIRDHFEARITAGIAAGRRTVMKGTIRFAAKLEEEP